MSMSASIRATEWKPLASVGNHSQVAMPLLSEVTQPQMLAEAILAKISFNGCLNEAAKHSGKEDQDIADEIHISHGYMSRFMRGVGQQWAKRLVTYMNATHSRAPLQWIAWQVGCDVVARTAQEAQIRALRQQLAALERGE